MKERESEVWADDGQLGMFEDLKNDWKREWNEMPAYEHDDIQPKFKLNVSFACWEDVEKFAELIGQRIYETTKTVWYPPLVHDKLVDKRFVDEEDRGKVL